MVFDAGVVGDEFVDHFFFGGFRGRDSGKGVSK